MAKAEEVEEMNYKWVEIIDTNGAKYTYEDCRVKILPWSVTIYIQAPLGEVTKVFEKRNIVCASYLPDSK